MTADILDFIGCRKPADFMDMSEEPLDLSRVPPTLTAASLRDLLNDIVTGGTPDTLILRGHKLLLFRAFCRAVQLELEQRWGKP